MRREDVAKTWLEELRQKREAQKKVKPSVKPDVVCKCTLTVRKESRPTRPVEEMDMDEQGLHEYLRNMTRPCKDFVFVPAEEEK